MNTQNIKTAASESSERWVNSLGINSLTPELTKSLQFLSALHTERMPLEERAELLFGSLINMAEQICSTVTDWSCGRPLMPLSSVQAWLAAERLVQGLCGETGEMAWKQGCEELAMLLEAGHAMFVADV